MANKNQPHDTGALIGIILFVVALVCWVLWMILSVQISSGIRWVRVGELSIAGLFTNYYDTLRRQLIVMPAADIKPEHLHIMTEYAADAMRFPIAGIFAIMGLIVLFKREKSPFARKFNFEALAKEQSRAFPVTQPIIKFNPLAENFRSHGSPVPDRLPLFAEALAPDEWVAHNSVPVTDGKIDMAFARIGFAKQLGKRWTKVQDLPIYAQALFAAFSMKANGLRTESDEFLGELSKKWEPGKGLVLDKKLRKQIKSKINDPKFGRVTEKICALHSFVNPAMARALQMARDNGGVLAPAQFLWLRAVDRHMWYALNNLGRSATHAEASGSLAHYRAEKAAGKPIPNPQMDVAVDGLINYLQENYITQFPAKEYGRSNKGKK